MKLHVSVPLLLLFLIFQNLGCASSTKSTLFGMTVGASLGGLLGNSQGDERGKSTANGLAIGAAAGALFGYLTHKDKKETAAITNLPTKEFEMPPITRPRVNCSQVPDAIDGNKWIEKHRVCIIDSPSTWSR